MSERRVTRLAITPIKGTRVREVESIELGPTGARGDRRFFIVDRRRRMVNGKRFGSLQAVDAEFDPDAGTLALSFPDGSHVEAPVIEGAEIETRFFSAKRVARLVDGPFAEALSAHVQEPLDLVAVASAVDRGDSGAASLISRASLERLAAEGQLDAIDARRFRMLIEVDGIEAHAEDRWVGRSVKVGEAVVRFEGHIGRCLVTGKDPETGDSDLPTLDILRAYRGEEAATEPLPFGIHGRVIRPGSVVVGDRVAPI